MVQIGEFSFVLAQLCLGAGILTGHTYSMILGAALVTIILTPFIFALTSKLCLRRREVIPVATGSKEQLALEPRALTKHVVICGHGRVGGMVALLLDQLSIPYVVIDLDPQTISELRDKGVPCIYGDAGSYKVLYEAGVKDAAVLVLAIPDPVSVRLALDHVRRIKPDIDTISRAHSDSELEFLQSRDVSEVVQPEREAGIEIVRHILCRLGMPADTVEEIIATQRKTCPK